MRSFGEASRLARRLAASQGKYFVPAPGWVLENQAGPETIVVCVGHGVAGLWPVFKLG
jgi:hypothetical protein